MKPLVSYVIFLMYAVGNTLAWGQCADAPVQQTQKQTAVVVPEYSNQIQRARQTFLAIYDHGLLGNSASPINNKVARPPGMSIAVAVAGKVVWAEGVGLADIEQCVPVTPKTKFRIGSTSKPLTSAGAALLYEQKRLDLDAPIQRYVPDFPDKGTPITTRELLGHLGGIRHYNADEALPNRDVYGSVTKSLKRFMNDALVTPPGTKFSYSTYGYVLISAVIEKASGEDFLSFMHNNVFMPLGMQDTVADESEKIVPHRARWYNVKADGNYRNSDYEDLSYKWAGGGFLSTAEDLARFGSAMLKAGFLKSDTLTMIFTPQKTNSGTSTNYGLGWFIHDAGGNGTPKQFEHSGGVAGSSSWLVLYPDRGVVIACVENSDDFRDWPILRVAAPFFSTRR